MGVCENFLGVVECFLGDSCFDLFQKLDGVGPVDDTPSTDFTLLLKKKINKKNYTRHVTPDT